MQIYTSLSVRRLTTWAHHLTDEAKILSFGQEPCNKLLFMALIVQNTGVMFHPWHTPQNKHVFSFLRQEIRIDRTIPGLLGIGGTVRRAE